MALIDNEEAARRLARVIISDIELYEKKKLQAGDDLTTQMAEGRALFHRRVVPELAAIFETIVEAKRSGASTGGPNALTPPPIGTQPRPSAAATTAAPVTRVTSVAPPAVDGPGATTALGDPEVVGTDRPAEDVLERAERKARAGEAGRPRANRAGTWAPEADVVEARLDDARPVEAILSEATARADLTAAAAAARNPDPSAGTAQGRAVGPHDRITPTAWAKPPEAPPQEELQDERVTSPVAFAAVTTTPEEPPIGARSPARAPAPPPAHTPAPSRASAVEPPAATPVPLGLVKAPAPQPIAVRHDAVPGPRGPADKTPVPLSVSLAALATVPPGALAAPPGPPAVFDEVVNLRAKTSKVRVLLYIVATAGGLALVGRFLTRFL